LGAESFNAVGHGTQFELPLSTDLQLALLDQEASLALGQLLAFALELGQFHDLR